MRPVSKTAIDAGRPGPEPLDDVDARHRAATFRPDHGLTLPVGPVPREFRGDADDTARLEPDPLQPRKARVRKLRHAVADRPVEPVDTVSLELCGEPVVRFVGLRDHQQPRGILVDPVHDARSFLATDAGEPACEMVQKRVDEGAFGRAGRGVDDESRRLVDDGKMRVLIDDVEIDRLGPLSPGSPARADDLVDVRPSATRTLFAGPGSPADPRPALTRRRPRDGTRSRA